MLTDINCESEWPKDLDYLYFMKNILTMKGFQHEKKELTFKTEDSKKI